MTFPPINVGSLAGTVIEIWFEGDIFLNSPMVPKEITNVLFVYLTSNGEFFTTILTQLHA